LTGLRSSLSYIQRHIYLALAEHFKAFAAGGSTIA
jgi:hypothetical protein